jgi:tetratricopeptide (TPR) repeat protein
MAEQDALEEGISLYNRMNYTGALSFFLSLPPDSGADPVDLAYYLGLCYAKLKRYDDAMIYLEQVVTAFGGDSATENGQGVTEKKNTGKRQAASVPLSPCNHLFNDGKAAACRF